MARSIFKLVRGGASGDKARREAGSPGRSQRAEPAVPSPALLFRGSYRAGGASAPESSSFLSSRGGPLGPAGWGTFCPIRHPFLAQEGRCCGDAKVSLAPSGVGAGWELSLS